MSGAARTGARDQSARPGVCDRRPPTGARGRRAPTGGHGRGTRGPAVVLMPGGIAAAALCRSALAASGTMTGRVALPAEAGFTLIEALVALAVLAVAAAGFLRSTQGHIDTVAGLEARAAGGWAADTALTEARLGVAPAATADVLGRTWRTSVASARSDDPDLAALTATTTAGGIGASLRGFRDVGPATSRLEQSGSDTTGPGVKGLPATTPTMPAAAGPAQ